MSFSLTSELQHNQPSTHGPSPFFFWGISDVALSWTMNVFRNWSSLAPPSQLIWWYLCCKQQWKCFSVYHYRLTLISGQNDSTSLTANALKLRKSAQFFKGFVYVDASFKASNMTEKIKHIMQPSLFIISSYSYLRYKKYESIKAFFSFAH